MSLSTVKGIVCDVNGTLFSLEPLAERMQQVGLQKTDLQVRTFNSVALCLYLISCLLCNLTGSCNRQYLSSQLLLQLWFTSVLRDGIATSTLGGFAPFKEIGTYHLQQMLAQATVPGDHSQAVQTVLSGFDDATCLNDIAPAFKQLHAKGIMVSVSHCNVGIPDAALECQVATRSPERKKSMHQYVEAVRRYPP